MIIPKNFAKTTLTETGGITTTTTTFEVNDLAQIPEAGGRIAVFPDGSTPESAYEGGTLEFMKIDSKSASTGTGNITVTRDVEDGTNNSFSVGAIIHASITNAFFGDIETDIANSGYDDAQLRTNINELALAIAQNQFELNLSQLGYKGGFFDIFVDQSKIETLTNVIFDSTDTKLKLVEEGDYSQVTGSPLNPAATDINVLTYNPDGTRLAVAVKSGNDVFIYDTSDSSITATIDVATQEILSLAYSPDGSTLAIGSEDDKIYIIETLTYTLVTTLTEAAADIEALDFNPDGTRLAGGANESKVRIYNTSDWSLVSTITTGTIMRSVSYSPDGTRLAVGQYDIEIYDTSDNSLVHTITDSGLTWGLDYNPDGTRLAFVSEYNEVLVFDTSDYSQVGTITAPTGQPREVKYSPDGTRLAIASDDYNVYVIDTSDYSVHATVSDATFVVNSVSYNSNGTHLAFGGDDDNVYIVEANIINASGTVISITKDLADDSMSVPKNVVFSQGAVIPTGATLEYKVIDGDGNEVSITQAEVAEEVSTTNFTSTIIKVEISMAVNGSDEAAELDDYAVHFTDVEQ